MFSITLTLTVPADTVKNNAIRHGHIDIISHCRRLITAPIHGHFRAAFHVRFTATPVHTPVYNITVLLVTAAAASRLFSPLHGATYAYYRHIIIVTGY
jgi:hypothetical protein